MNNMRMVNTGLVMNVGKTSFLRKGSIATKVRDFSCPAPLGWMKSKVKQSPVGLWFADKRNPELEIKALARGERSSTGKQGFYFTALG